MFPTQSTLGAVHNPVLLDIRPNDAEIAELLVRKLTKRKTIFFTTPPRLNLAQVIAAKQLAQKAVRKRQLPPLPAAQPRADVDHVDNGPLPRGTTPPRVKAPALPTQPAAAAGEAMQAPPNEPETSEQSVPPKGAPPTLAAMSAARSSGATPPRKTRGRAPILPSQRKTRGRAPILPSQRGK